MLSELMTAVPGASQVFRCAAVTYSTDAKTDLLGVDPDLISRYGVVSKETALAMVKGIAQRAGTDVAVSITGYAGPRIGNEPVGTVCIAVVAPGCQNVKEFQFTGNRDRIRVLSVVNALDMVRRAILHIESGE